MTTPETNSEQMATARKAMHGEISMVAMLSVLLLTILATLPGCGKQRDERASENLSTLSRIQKDHAIHVAFIDYPPAVFRDTGDREVKGHFADTIEEIIHQLDPEIRIVYEETTWADFTAALNTHRVDLSIAPTFATIPRAKLVSFTRPLVYLGQSAIVRADDKRFQASSGPMQFDREDLKIGVVEGEASHEFVKANFKHLQSVVVFSGGDLSQCLAAVSAGQVDVGMSDALETAKYSHAHKDVIDLFGQQPYNLTPIAWAVRQDDYAWRDFLNTALETLQVHGKLAQFETRYGFSWMHEVREYRPR